MPAQSKIQAYVQLTRPQNATGSAITYCIGYFLSHGSSVKTGFFAGLFILLAIHSLATVQNDVVDFEIDKANKRRNALQEHSLSIAQARFFVRALGVAAITVAVISTQREIQIGAVFILLLLTWLYNVAPVRASKRPVSSIVILGLCFGSFPLIYGYLVAQGRLTVNLLILAFFWFMFRVSTSIMKDYKDVKGDRIFSKNTFYLKYGPKITASISLSFCAIAYIAAIAIIVSEFRRKGVFFDITITLSGLLALRSSLQRLSLWRSKNDKQRNVVFHNSVFTHNQFEAALLLCLILS
jgi:4-hydroxybenzoate polyprenyltransferase